MNRLMTTFEESLEESFVDVNPWYPFDTVELEDSKKMLSLDDLVEFLKEFDRLARWYGVAELLAHNVV